MNTILISEEEIEAILQAWYETDGIRVYRDELEPVYHAYLGELVFKPDCTINEEKQRHRFPYFCRNRYSSRKAGTISLD